MFVSVELEVDTSVVKELFHCVKMRSAQPSAHLLKGEKFMNKKKLFGRFRGSFKYLVVIKVVAMLSIASLAVGTVHRTVSNHQHPRAKCSVFSSICFLEKKSNLFLLLYYVNEDSRSPANRQILLEPIELRLDERQTSVDGILVVVIQLSRDGHDVQRTEVEAET